MIGQEKPESQVPHGRPVFRPDDIPPQLRPDLPIWVVWGPAGDGHADKCPRDPRHLRPAPPNAGQWFTLEGCLAAVQANPERLFGVGRMMNAAEDGIVGIDLDHVMECDAGVEFLDEIRRAMPFAYVERSPSGTGVRLFAWAPAAVAEMKAKGRESVKNARYPVEGCGVEIYANGRGGRHLTITGDTIHRGDLEVDSSRAVLDLVTSLEPKARPAAVQAQAHDSTATDADVARAMLPLLADARAGDHDEWIGVGLACMAAGLTLADWLEFSRRCPAKFDAAECERRWATFSPRTAKVSWLVAKAQEDAGKGQVRDAFRELHRGKPRGPGWNHAKELQREFHAEARGGDLAARKERAEAVRAAERAEIEATEYACLDEFVEEHRHAWRYVAARGNWLQFREGWWRYDAEGRLPALVRSAVEAKFPPKLHTIMRANSIAAAARAPMHLEVGELDRDPWVIGVGHRGAGKVVDLRTGEIRAARAEEFVTRSTDVMPAPGAPTWARCLEEWARGDGELVTYLRRIAGYWLSGSVAYHEFYVLHGPPGTGKSRFVEAIAAAMGPSYAGGINLAAILDTGGNSHSTSRAKLCGLRLAHTSEIPEGAAWNESALKSITGGDTITGNFKYHDEFSFAPTHKLVISTNHLPRVRDTGPLRRRVRVIPFEAKVARDPALPEILAAEAAGILAWAIEGAREVAELLAHREAMPMPAAVRKASEEYLDAEDWFGQFVEDRCQVDPGAGHWFTPSEALVKEFTDWAPKAGISPHASITARMLGNELPRRYGLKPKQLATGDRCRGWSGIRLRRLGEEIPV